jgi:hypothetical protein
VDSGIAASAKRYRYTGKERDEETGLGDGVNRYAYASGNPVLMRDPSGCRPCLAADKTVVELDAEDNKAIKAAIKKQRGPGGYLVAGTDRAELAEQVISKL